MLALRLSLFPKSDLIKMEQTNNMNVKQLIKNLRFLLFALIFLISCTGKDKADRPEKAPKFEKRKPVAALEQPAVQDTLQKPQHLELLDLTQVEEKPGRTVGF